MLMTLDEASKRIKEGALLHIAGVGALLKKLPKGNWVGGSTEHFMAEGGGKVSDGLLFVTEFPYKDFTIKQYDTETIKNVAADAFDNGFSIVIIPFDSALHKVYAEKAPGFEGMFIKNVGGWISGVSPDAPPGQAPIAVNGLTGEVYTDRGAALHIGVPGDKSVTIGVINIFSQDETAPAIEFPEEGFSVTKCLVDGKETVFADYVNKIKYDTRQPIVGNYAGNGVNVSFRSIEGGVVNFYSPVFVGIKYKIAKPVPNYAEEFGGRLANHLSKLDAGTVFSCNCYLNFVHGKLEGRSTEHFVGPITYGEIAYQLVSQTLVYITVI
jgi:hypothetical protein